MNSRSVVGSLAGVMKGRNVSMDVKRGLRNSILLPTLTYGSENWTWNEAQQWRVCAVEMSYLKGACGVSRGVFYLRLVAQPQLLGPDFPCSIYAKQPGLVQV